MKIHIYESMEIIKSLNEGNIECMNVGNIRFLCWEVHPSGDIGQRLT